MDWKEAAESVEYLIKRINSSILLTLYGFSIWSIPYLLQKGLTLDQIKAFGGSARKMLVKSLDDKEGDFRAEEGEMDAIFSTWRPQINGRPDAPQLVEGTANTPEVIRT